MTALQRPKPLPGIYDEPYWMYVNNGDLRLQRCAECGQLRYPPSPVCPDCLTDEHVWAPLSGSGTLLAWTVFRRQYFPEIPVPYVVAAVQSREGPILIGNVVGATADELEHGMRMRAVYEDVDAQDGTWRICQWSPAQNPSIAEEHQ